MIRFAQISLAASWKTNDGWVGRGRCVCRGGWCSNPAGAPGVEKLLPVAGWLAWAYRSILGLILEPYVTTTLGHFRI